MSEDAARGRPAWLGLVMFGIFALLALSGLGTIFVGVGTAVQAWEEHAQEDWPVVTALLRNATCDRRARASATGITFLADSTTRSDSSRTRRTFIRRVSNGRSPGRCKRGSARIPLARRSKCATIRRITRILCSCRLICLAKDRIRRTM